jgi:hypothetical protein
MIYFYWLLERSDSPVSAPVYVAARADDTDRDPKGHAYTSDPFAAMRFGTFEGAVRYAERFLAPGAVRVCEHGFDGGPR